MVDHVRADSLLSVVCFPPRVIPEDGLLVIFLLRAREGELRLKDVDCPTDYQTDSFTC